MSVSDGNVAPFWPPPAALAEASPACRRSPPPLPSANGVRPPQSPLGQHSEKVHGATRFAVPNRSFSRPPARKGCAGRRSRGDVGPAASQCAELLVGCGGHDDDVTRPVGAPERRHGAGGVVHGARHPIEQRLCRGPPRLTSSTVRPSETVSVLEATADVVGVSPEQGWAERVGPADKRHRHDQLEDQQQAQQGTSSTGGCCRSGHCSPVPLAPACRRWTRAPSFRRRCRSPSVTRRSSS